MSASSHKGGAAEAAYREELDAYLAHGADGAL